MSKVGRKPINIPSGVDIKINEKSNTVTVKGKLGELVRTFDSRIQLTIEDNQVIVKRTSEVKTIKMLHGLTRALLANMVEGVTNGFQKRLELKGVGYRAIADAKKISLSLGFSHPIEIPVVPGIQFNLPADTIIEVKGIDKELVGSVSASIRKLRNPDPYKNKGVHYTGEVMIKKAGKALGKAGK
jgi:large subunit ribosomal protein L6